jgi:hypothetical protein
MKTVIEMAQQTLNRDKLGFWTAGMGDLEAFAELVRADAIAEEREACVNLRKKVWLVGIPNTDYEDGFWDALAKYEDMIRARGNT